MMLNKETTVTEKKTITINEAYRKNKEQYEKDCAEFEEYVNSMLADEEVANED